MGRDHTRAAGNAPCLWAVSWDDPGPSSGSRQLDSNEPPKDTSLEAVYSYAVADLRTRNSIVIFAFPGQPEYRMALGKYVPPPRVHFNDLTLHAERSHGASTVSKIMVSMGHPANEEDVTFKPAFLRSLIFVLGDSAMRNTRSQWVCRPRLSTERRQKRLQLLLIRCRRGTLRCQKTGCGRRWASPLNQSVRQGGHAPDSRYRKIRKRSCWRIRASRWHQCKSRADESRIVLVVSEICASTCNAGEAGNEARDARRGLWIGSD